MWMKMLARRRLDGLGYNLTADRGDGPVWRVAHHARTQPRVASFSILFGVPSGKLGVDIRTFSRIGPLWFHALPLGVPLSTVFGHDPKRTLTGLLASARIVGKERYAILTGSHVLALYTSTQQHAF
jgi:hypothetical protein